MSNFIKIAIVLLILITNFSFSTYSQQPSFSLEAGVTIPVGDFGKKDINNEKSGYAKIRSILAASYQNQFKDSQFGYIFNVTSLKNGYHGGHIFDKYQDDLPRIIVDTKPWTALMFMSGIFYRLSLNDDMSAFYFKGMAGISNATSYGYMVRGNDYSKIQLHEKRDTGLGYAFGLDFRTEIFDIEGLNLIGSCNYISSNHKFKNVRISDSRTAETMTSFKQRFQNISIGMGVSFEFQ